MREKIKRPWGYFEVLDEYEIDGRHYKIKTFTVNPGHQLSVQYHAYRSELWKVLSGEGIATVDTKEIHLYPFKEIFIVPKDVHTVKCDIEEKEPLIIHETQISILGFKCEETDIVRIKDIYNRKHENLARL